MGGFGRRAGGDLPDDSSAPVINVNVNLILPDRAVRLLDQIAAGVATLVTKGNEMSKELDDLEAAVTQNSAVDQSAITLLQGLAAQIESMKTDPVKLQKFANDLRASSDALAAAVTANTPSDTTGGTTTGGDTGGGTTGGTDTGGGTTGGTDTGGGTTTPTP